MVLQNVFVALSISNIVVDLTVTWTWSQREMVETVETVWFQVATPGSKGAWDTVGG